VEDLAHPLAPIPRVATYLQDAKKGKSDSQKEKDRKRKEHAARVLSQQNKKQKPVADANLETSAFEALFAQRAQGFKVDFAFRNAPPRPPVGPCFVGLGLEGVLQDASQYRPLNAVEVNYTWKLHSEPDLGVPLAPSAMNLFSYEKPANTEKELHPEDLALLEWKGSMGDTAAEQLQKHRDNERARARLALAGKTPVVAAQSNLPTKKVGNKEFSRVLDESLPFYMKKTTYLSNDHSRKVHDFKSLADTTQEKVMDLQAKQRVMQLARSAQAISKTFSHDLFVMTKLKHPTKSNAKPVSVMPLLPLAEHWGHAYTHVVMDNPPKNSDDDELKQITKSFIAHVEKKLANDRMKCQLLIPAGQDGHEYRSLQQYDLDVTPLKEDGEPNVNFVFFLGDEEAMYLPISSRVNLSTGRPSKKWTTITRRALSEEEQRHIDEGIAEVDVDVAKKLKGTKPAAARSTTVAHDNSDESE
jgi:hypothetical protein